MKQTETTVKRINGTTFYITPFPAFTAARVSGDLSAILAPVLGSLAPLLDGYGDDGSGNIMDMDMDTLLKVVADALGQLTGDSLERLAKELFVDYKNVAFENEDGTVERLTYDTANEVFCTDLMGMILLGIEVVRINFGGFFGSLADQFGSLQGTTGLTTVAGSYGTKNGESST